MSETVEWCVAYGGPEPDNCAGVRVFDSEADAIEEAQWMKDSSVWVRSVTLHPWREVET